MRRLQYIALFALAVLLTACGTEPKKAAILNALPTPYPTAELLIAPPEMATPTKWLSPMSATTKAMIEERERWTPTPFTPLPTPTRGIHMPTNIYSPTPDPDRSKDTSSSSCSIKGNVNSRGERIYHCPGWRDYSKTDMNSAEGDTWFCSVADAKAAGFREAEYPHGECFP